MRTATYLALVLFLTPVLLLGCSDSSGPGSGNDTGRVDGPITLKTAWPDDDGRSWVYGAGQSFRDGLDPLSRPPAYIPVFDTKEDVPDMPSIDAFEELLASYDLSDPGVDNLAYGLTFDGHGTTDSGADGKNLARMEITTLERSTDPLLAVFIQHRPDLRERFPEAGKISLAYNPTLVRDGIWVRTNECIAFYNDLDTEAHYRILESDLTPGHEWSVALLPTLTSDGPILHARVLGPVQPKLPIGGREPTTLRVLYTFDMGIITQRDEQLNTTGYSRVAAFGIVDYLQDVGPSHYHEFHFIYLDKAQDGSTIILEPAAQLWGWLRDWEDR